MSNSEGERRPARTGLIALAALVVAAVVVLGIAHFVTRTDASDGAEQSTASTSSPTSTGTPPPASANALPVGITFGGKLFGRSRAEVDHALDEVVALHMSWIRVDLSWASLRPLPNRPYGWASMDRIIASATAHRLRVLGLVTYTPEWARTAGCTAFVCAPGDRRQFAAFAAAAVARYVPRGVTTYQVWNEPNIDLFWHDPAPAAYGRLLAAAVAAMRAATTRQIHILFGGLAFTTDGTGNIAPARFLVDACRAQPCRVDAVGYDPFTYPELPSDTTPPLNAWQLMSNPDAGADGIRDAARQVGLGNAKIWVTEFGAPTAYPGSAGTRTVSEAVQGKIVVDGLRLARAESAYVGGYFVDTLRDTFGSGTIRDHFGLIRHDGITRKAAFAALARAVADG